MRPANDGSTRARPTRTPAKRRLWSRRRKQNIFFPVVFFRARSRIGSRWNLRRRLMRCAGNVSVRVNASLRSFRPRVIFSRRTSPIAQKCANFQRRSAPLKTRHVGIDAMSNASICTDRRCEGSGEETVKHTCDVAAAAVRHRQHPHLDGRRIRGAKKRKSRLRRRKRPGWRPECEPKRPAAEAEVRVRDQ